MTKISSVKSLPLCITQRQFYSSYLLDPKSTNYNIGVAIQLEGSIDCQLLNQAINLIISKHEVLRTAFIIENDKPVAVIEPEIKAKVPLVKLEKASDKKQQQTLRKIIENVRDESFDLAQLPLFRFQLVEVNSLKHVFVAIFHHMVMDGWSLIQFVKELLDYYGKLKQDPNLTATPLDHTYSDYVAWQRKLEQTKGKAILEFWKQQFVTIPEPLQLPTDYYRGALPVVIDEFQFTLEPSLVAQLKTVAQENGVSLFVCLLSAYQLFLANYTQQNKIVIGVPFFGRDTYKFEELLGLFIHTLPLTIELQVATSFNEMLGKNQSHIAAAHKHQYLPLTTLFNELEITRSINTQPLFQALFNVGDFLNISSKNGDIETDIIWKDTGRAAYDLSLEVELGTNSTQVSLKYNSNLFKLTTIERMAHHFILLLTKIAVASPQQPITDYTLLTEKELEQLLVTWNETARDYPHKKCLHQLVEEQTKRTPQQIALFYADQKITYKELNTKANQLAHHLIEQSIQSEAIIAISLERSIDSIIAMLAVLKAGYAYLFLDHSNPEERLIFMLQDSRASLLITKSVFKTKFMEYAGKILFLDEQQAIFNTKNRANLNKPIRSDNLAYVIYTSGSTGTPKGVMIEHRGVVNCIYTIQTKVNVQPDNIFLAVTALSFDVAMLDYFLPLAIGAKTIIVEQAAIADPGSLLKLFDTYQPNIMQATPALWRMLQRAEWQANAGFKVLTAGEALSEELAASLLQQKCVIFNIYGPTEATIYTTLAEITSPNLITIGKPLANIQTYILNNNQQPVPIGVWGELYIGGVGLARGYLNQPKLTEERFIANPFATEKNERLYRTGDLVRYLPDGNIQYLRRIDQQVKLRGYRIELGEIETSLAKIPNVLQTAVILYAAEKLPQKQLIAFLVMENAAQSINMNFEQELAKWLPHYMIPSHFILVEQLPISPNGKINKDKLQNIARHKLAETRKTGEKSSNNTLVECLYADIKKVIASILSININQIDAIHAFGDYGFDSLSFGEFSIKLSKKYSIEITPVIFYRYFNLKLLAEYLIKTHSAQIEKIYANAFSNENKSNAANLAKITIDTKQNVIAVIGIAGKLPQSEGIQAFWQNLLDSRDLISTIPTDRWDWREYINYSGTKWGGFINNVDQFDADFFNISPLEAKLMDPQQRILLESAWGTIEDAGYSAAALSGSNTGVFIGSTGSEYILMQQQAGLDLESHSISGSAQSIAANRISYFFNFKGPSAAIDTACSSSLVALHRAIVAMNAGECSMAIVSGVNLLLTPEVYKGLSKMNMLSENGRCKTFDESANGYVRAEGVITVLLKPLSQAQSDNDHIYAVIKGSAENHGGRTHGLTVPNPDAQSQLIIQAYQKAEVAAETVTYIETHGTGTRLGDPIEIDGLQRAFQELYQQQNTDFKSAHCGIGSVKSNMGHLEGAAGIAGFLKVVLALKHKILPANLHLERQNSNIKLAGSPFYLVQETRAWPVLMNQEKETIPRRAGVSSFGFGGSNVHVVLEEAPARILVEENHKPYYVLTFSAKQLQSLSKRLQDLSAWLSLNANMPLAAIAYTLNTGREHFAYRCALVVSSLQDLQFTLEQVQANSHPQNYFCVTDLNPHKFSGEDILNESQNDLKNYQHLTAQDYQKTLFKLAEFYCQGQALNWDIIHQDESKQRIALPTYPFLGKPYWFTSKQIDSTLENRGALSYYTPVWEQQELSIFAKHQNTIKSVCIVSNDNALVESIRQQLNSIPVIQLCLGDNYNIIDSHTYQVRLAFSADYHQFITTIKNNGLNLSHFLFISQTEGNSYSFEQELQKQVLFIQQLLLQNFSESFYFLNVYQYHESRLMSEQALIGFAKSLTRENSSCVMCLLGVETLKISKSLNQQIIDELTTLTVKETVHVHYKNNLRYIEHYQALAVTHTTLSNSNDVFKKDGVYLITGGLGQLGFQIAKYLATTYHAKLILTGRSVLDKNKELQLEELTFLGANAHYVMGDVTHEKVVDNWVVAAKQYFGKLDGVIHCAGCLQDSLLINKDWDAFTSVLAPKITGTLLLDKATAAEPLDCFILFSSLTACIGSIGQTDYACSNAFLNTFAVWREHQLSLQHRHGKTVSINWPYWLEGGMKLSDYLLKYLNKAGLYPLPTQQAMQAFSAILQQTSAVTGVLYGEPFEKIKHIFNSEPIIDRKTKLVENIPELIAQLVAEQVGMVVEDIKLEVPLFEQGIDSILLTQALSKIEQEFECDLSAHISAILQEPSINNIAKQLLAFRTPVRSSNKIVEERVIEL